MKTRTMYMHLLDEKPASFDGKDYIFFASGRTKATLAPTLDRLRSEQQKEIARIFREAPRSKKHEAAKLIRERLGYVKVGVPLCKCGCGRLDV